VDHIYREKGVFKKDDIYFIADSKYYSEKSTVDPYSSYKQFTYARNVLALNLDIFGDKKRKTLNYQDQLTDGYHPSPNFFISAFFEDKLKLTDSGLKKEESDFVKRSSHWDNRLFDRDTLFTLSYRINFMFALQTFVRRSNSRLKTFKKETRNEFRKEFIEYLDSRYLFYRLSPKNDFKEAIDNNFKLLLGVSFCPDEDKKELILALEKDEENGGKEKDHRGLNASTLKRELRHDWNMTKTDLKDYERENRGKT
jgi:hypothetical protein